MPRVYTLLALGVIGLAALGATTDANAQQACPRRPSDAQIYQALMVQPRPPTSLTIVGVSAGGCYDVRILSVEYIRNGQLTRANFTLRPMDNGTWLIFPPANPFGPSVPPVVVAGG